MPNTPIFQAIPASAVGQSTTRFVTAIPTASGWGLQGRRLSLYCDLRVLGVIQPPGVQIDEHNDGGLCSLNPPSFWR